MLFFGSLRIIEIYKLHCNTLKRTRFPLCCTEYDRTDVSDPDLHSILPSVSGSGSRREKCSNLLVFFSKIKACISPCTIVMKNKSYFLLVLEEPEYGSISALELHQDLC
jgi:hypothetical protein